MSLLALGELATLATAEIIAAACNAWIPIAVGTYTSSGSEGIYLCRFNQESGEAELKATAATDNPSFLAASPDGRIIYAVDESGLDTDGVKAFALAGESTLSCMRSVPAAGKAPCYMLAGEHFVATANYTDGSISVFSLDHQGFLEKRIQNSISLSPVLHRTLSGSRARICIVCRCRPTSDTCMLAIWEMIAFMSLTWRRAKRR